MAEVIHRKRGAGSLNELSYTPCGEVQLDQESSIDPRDVTCPLCRVFDSVGPWVVDPHGRHVRITRVLSELEVEVRLGGSYGAHVRYPVSSLRSAR